MRCLHLGKGQIYFSDAKMLQIDKERVLYAKLSTFLFGIRGWIFASHHIIPKISPYTNSSIYQNTNQIINKFPNHRLKNNFP